jgi:phage terminase small subunit
MALTQKKKAFAQAKHDGADNRQAALFAGYSQESASQAGSRLAKDSDVISHIEQLANVKAQPKNVKAALPEQTAATEVKRAAFACEDPMDKLMEYMNCGDPEVEFEAAKVLMPYKHGKVAEKGKKETKADEAKNAAKSGGKFGTLNSQLPS